jgi:hypothetical protein
MAASFSTEKTAAARSSRDEPRENDVDASRLREEQAGEDQASTKAESVTPSAVVSEKAAAAAREDGEQQTDTQQGEVNNNDVTPAAECSDAADAAAGETVEDESQYPVKWKLGLITIALCLSVFCVALVSSISTFF